jgi:DNA-binding XRE family transcriptional regulator
MTKKILQGNAGIKTDTILDKMYFDSSELVREINTLVERRKKWGHTQKQVANECGVSVPTIKRFEKLKVDSLSLFLNYKQLFS